MTDQDFYEVFSLLLTSIKQNERPVNYIQKYQNNSNNYTCKVGGWPSSLQKGGGRMTAFEALSLVAQFSLTIVAVLTLVVTVVVFIEKKK